MHKWRSKHSYYFSYIKNSRLRLGVAPIDARGWSFWLLLTVPAGHLLLNGISTSDIVVGVWKILRNASKEHQRPQMFSWCSSRLRKQWQVTLHLKYSGMGCCGPSFLGLFFFFLLDLWLKIFHNLKYQAHYLWSAVSQPRAKFHICYTFVWFQF